MTGKTIIADVPALRALVVCFPGGPNGAVDELRDWVEMAAVVLGTVKTSAVPTHKSDMGQACTLDKWSGPPIRKDKQPIKVQVDKDGKTSAREVVLHVLRQASAPMGVKAMAVAAEGDPALDVSGFRDLRSAIGFQVKRMETAGEIVLADVNGNANLYALPKGA